MAFNLKLYCLYMIVLVMFVLVKQEPSGSNNGQRSFYANAASLVNVKSRKVLVVSRDDFRGRSGNGEMLEVRELRDVPSGPDPLHHNGVSPRKPRIL